MRITDLLKIDSIELNVCASSKKEIINNAIDLMEKGGNITNCNEYKRDVLKREEEGTTGVGDGIAIPHAKSKAVKSAGISAMVIPGGVNFDSLDGKKVTLLFLIAAPDNNDNIHLEVLSRLSTLLMDEKFRLDLQNAKSKEGFLNIINDAEKEKFVDKAKNQVLDEVKKKENKLENISDAFDILAITSCPTGIAHTYMSAESLEKAGREMNIKIKVETQGQVGAKNVLTKEEIKNAKAIIVASDTKVDLSRFDGKKLLKTKVADGIYKPKELIENALSTSTPVFYFKGSKQEDSDDSEKFSRKIYKHLMNGVTHMLPFVIGGGILIAIAFLVDDYSVNPSNFGMNTPLATFFKTIGNFAFDFMLCILAGYIAMSIADRPGLAVGFVGGAIAKAGTTFSSLTDSNIAIVSSGFIGALIAGFLGGYIIILLQKMFKFLPKSLEGLKPILIYPLFGIFLIGTIMLAINPYISSINTSLNNFLDSMSGTNKILLGALLGGMMSVDLGGPVNKSAYTFGTGMLAEGNYEIMASVMAGGMVAPLVIAILATVLPKKFPKKERGSALLNYILGFSFISEGAIPFASADPLRVIPSCIIGSSIAGALSMMFSCKLMAPHGGIFVIPIVENPIMYLISIMIGAIVGAIILGVLKKNVTESL
jgi:PTS system fructose-specific IIC component